MLRPQRRVVSLLPSTTEIVAALGYEKQLVGRSHECDVPKSVASLPACTQPKFEAEGQSYEIDQRVKALLQEGLSVYQVDAQKLASLEPDLIITQDHCEVCAATFDDVQSAVRKYLKSTVEIISVSPTDLAGVYDSILTIAAALDAKDNGHQLIKTMMDTFNTLSSIGRDLNSKKLLCIEWLDPLMTAGNWVPELAEIAGLEYLGAKPGNHSPWMDWEQINRMKPDIIGIIPCGYSIGQTLEQMNALTSKGKWDDLDAVQNRQVFIADGHHYFNRPGPRLTASARILAEMAHPKLEATLKNKGWINYYKRPLQNPSDG